MIVTKTSGRIHLVHGLEPSKPCLHSLPLSQVVAVFSLKLTVPTVTAKLLSHQPPFFLYILYHQITALTTPPCCHSSTDSLNNVAASASSLPSPNASPVKILRNSRFYEPSPSNTLASCLLDVLISPVILSFILPQPPTPMVVL